MSASVRVGAVSDVIEGRSWNVVDESGASFAIEFDKITSTFSASRATINAVAATLKTY